MKHVLIETRNTYLIFFLKQSIVVLKGKLFKVNILQMLTHLNDIDLLENIFLRYKIKSLIHIMPNT